MDLESMLAAAKEVASNHARLQEWGKRSGLRLELKAAVDHSPGRRGYEATVKATQDRGGGGLGHDGTDACMAFWKASIEEVMRLDGFGRDLRGLQGKVQAFLDAPDAKARAKAKKALADHMEARS